MSLLLHSAGVLQSEECPPGSEDFREMQCAAYNDRPLVAGIAYRWTTFHGGSNPCELSCLAQGHNFYYNFGRVLDGTSCSKDSGAVCVNGRCLPSLAQGSERGQGGGVGPLPGCDLILGSNQQEDACMHYQNGHAQFVINGHWKISVPGEYSVAGTKLLYRRSADTWESFEVPGPTHEDLHIMVLATDSNPGIEYEYWLPPDRYALYHGRRSPLRQPHHTASYLPWGPPPTPSTTTTRTTTTTTTTTRRPLPASIRPKWVHPRKLACASPSDQPRPQPTSPSSRQRQQQPHPTYVWRGRTAQRNLLPHSPPGRHCGKCRRVRGRGERQRQYCLRDFVFRGKVMGKLYRGEETRYDVQVIHTYRNRYRLEHREFLWVSNVCDCPHLEQGRQYVLMVRRHINYEHTLDRILLEEGSYVALYRPREDALLRPLEETCSNRGPKKAAELRGYA
ncbi:hypothetical protein CRUP_032680 [Coryphaenoides rupestris]|nr:hypothetical protein CRUP_032680 [Coryphaenoides rupestris]